MKALTTLLFSILFSLAFAQKADLATVQNFWDNNIMEIVRLDKEKILEHTAFPVTGSWGYAIELDGGPEDWKNDDYTNNLDKIYNEELRIKLRGMNYNSLVHHMDDDGELNFILQLSFETVTDDGTFESATLLYFKKYDGIWKIYQIEHAG
jgi:hypothetical protein